MSANNRLARFVADLFLDQDKLRRYLKDPEAEMSAADLTEEQKQVLRTGDFKIICKYCRRGARPTPEEQISGG